MLKRIVAAINWTAPSYTNIKDRVLQFGGGFSVQEMKTGAVLKRGRESPSGSQEGVAKPDKTRKVAPKSPPAPAEQLEVELPTTTPQGGVALDGSMLEGGGQILRNGAALSAITGVPIRIDKIRLGRKSPGIRPQHLAGIKLIQTLCQGALGGAKVSSTVMTMAPRALRCGSHVADTGTAGSCMLLAQAALPCMLFAGPGRGSADGSRLTALELKGGTDAGMAPPVGYTQLVLLPLLQRLLGIEVEMSVVRRGFYPKGGGIVKLSARGLPGGSNLAPINLMERGNVTSVVIRSFAAGRVHLSAAQRMARTAENDVRKALGPDVEILTEAVEETPVTAVGDGAGILLVADTDSGCKFGAAVVGERGVPAETTAANAASELLQALASGGCVDQWMQDQLIIFMALAEGVSRVRCGAEPTLHTRTAMVVAEKLTAAKFTLTRPSPASDQCWLIECRGAGIRAPRN